MIKKALKKALSLSLALTTTVLAFVPEPIFAQFRLFCSLSKRTNIIINRVLILVLAYIIILTGLIIRNVLRKRIVINGNSYKIVVKYGDIFKQKNCKKIIGFDECFTTKVGEAPNEIKPNSICGQYLKQNTLLDINAVIKKADLRPLNTKSLYKKRECYESGSIVPNGEYFLLAFAKLDESGIGTLSRQEYIKCLEKMWEDIDRYYASTNVCIPIIGSGITRMNDELTTQQYLLDIIIASYKMSAHKIKLPQKLIIICKKQDGFSLNRIGECI